MSLKLFVCGLILGLGSLSFAVSSEYCREVKSDGSFGRPTNQVFRHCVQVDFKSLKLVDNAPSFFGNPPEVFDIRFQENEIEVLRENNWETVYTFSEDGLSLSNSAGAVLTYRGEVE